MIKGVAFDFDCTMYDRTGVWERLSRSFLTRFGKNINHSLSADAVLEILRQGDAEGIANDNNWQGIFARYIKKDLFAAEPSFEEFFAFIEAEFPSAIVLRPDTMKCLQELKRMGMKTGIYTNGLSDYGRLKIRATGIDGLMDHILCSGDINIEKPDARGFAVLAAGMGLQLEEIAFVGDHPKNDVLGAQNAGMTGIWIEAMVPWPGTIDAPEHSVKKLSEVIDLVSAMNSREGAAGC